VAACLVAASLIAAVALGGSPATRRHGHVSRGAPTRADGAAGRAKPGTRALPLGRSVQGRRIEATVLGDPRAPHPVLVFGAVHGDEPAGIRVARSLAHTGAPARGAIWIVEDLNPDGTASGTRQNARGVDLNRNFPFGWRPIGHRGDQQYSGLRALSEPESRLAYALVLRIRPRIAIWFHQPLGVVDESGGRLAVERRFARFAGLSLRRLTRYPGSATGWENHRFPNSTAFVVELPAGRLGARRAGSLAHAIRRIGEAVPR